MRGVADALPGRMETVELWPLSQGEIDDQPDGFVDRVFADGSGIEHASDETRDGYLHRIVRGGFPDVLGRTEARARRYLDQYVADLVNRDAIQVLAVERPDALRTLIKLIAARSGGLLVPHQIAQRMSVSPSTVARYVTALEEVFLIRRIPAWSRGSTTRAVGTPKVVFVDSGLAARQVGATAAKLAEPGGALGGLLEGFVAAEIARQLTWSECDASLYHYRTRDGVEVDLVLEAPDGTIVGIEVKAGMTVRSDDFRGLRHLADKAGDDFLAGIVLYLGRETLSFGPRLKALPVASLWQL
jgi:predicted AAA+ superfamily ATPase